MRGLEAAGDCPVGQVVPSASITDLFCDFADIAAAEIKGGFGYQAFRLIMISALKRSKIG
jgi:hypothetical protein